jgi:transposase
LLKALAHRGTAEHRQVTRARIVLLAAAGWTNAGIARKLGLAPNTVSKWRKRFYQEGVDGLRDRKRPGRPRAFTAPVVAACKAIACELPATRGVPLGRWSLAELRTELLATGLVDDVSTTTLWRWLDEDPIKPWQHHSWIFPRDPDFAAKAGVVLDLYDRSFQGKRLGEGEYVISADEKTSIQARCRCHPILPPGARRTMRVEHEYQRGGALAYLAAWDVHQARLFGRCEPSTGIAPFGRLVSQVMTVEPYASARRVFWGVDNGSSHRGQASIDRLEGAWPNLTLVHLPVHASWLNQIEIYFSVVQRKVLTPNDFTDLDEVARRLLGFQRRYQQTAVPFDWRFTRADLAKLLRRLDARQQHTTAA